MQRSLKPLFIRGVLGTTLSIAAVGGAATQAMSFEGEMRFEQGRLVLVEARELAAQCLALPRREGARLTRIDASTRP